jgi:predicted permease
MDTLLRDLRYSVRALRARPLFTAITVLTLALGIGASTAIFSAVNALLLRPLPIEDVDRLVFGSALREGVDPFGVSFLEYQLYRSEARSLASSALATQHQFNLIGDGEPERLKGALVMASYLPTLGVKPALGRIFTPDEDRQDGPAVALISHALWKRRFGGAANVVGRTLDLEGRSHTVVGVMPPGFDIPYFADVWVPMQLSIDSLPFDQKAALNNEFIARLRPGASLDQASVELKALARRLEDEHPQVRRGWSIGIVPLRRALLGDLQGGPERALLVLAVGVGFLLLICCANVASLLLARGAAREGEIAIRRSLGAGRAVVARQLLTESSVLALLGGVGGLLLACWIRPALAALNPIQAAGLGAHLSDFEIDGRVLAFSLGVTLLTGVLFGLAPALAAGTGRLMSVIKRQEQRGGTSAAATRWLSALVVAEMAVATMLLASGGLVLQSFQRLQAIDLGFRPQRLVTMELSLPRAKYETLRSEVLFMESVLERVRALPGVAAAGISNNTPMQRLTLDSVFEVEGRKPANPSDVPITAHRLVTSGYQEALGVTLLKGRLLDANDREGSLPVAVVSEELARQAWPGEDPIGKRLRRLRGGKPAPWMTVVGLVKDVKEDRLNFRGVRPVWYVPYSQETLARMFLPLNLIVRATTDGAGIVAGIRKIVRSIDPGLPVANPMPMEEQFADLLISDRFGAVLMAALAAAGLLLAALGLYGVMAYSVNQRVGEIGLRMALGAQRRDVRRLIVRKGLRLSCLGLGLGLVGGWILARLIASRLYGVSASAPWTFVAAPLVLTAVALLACWLPAERATRIDPMEALR